MCKEFPTVQDFSDYVVRNGIYKNPKVKYDDTLGASLHFPLEVNNIKMEIGSFTSINGFIVIVKFEEFQSRLHFTVSPTIHEVNQVNWNIMHEFIGGLFHEECAVVYTNEDFYDIVMGEINKVTRNPSNYLKREPILTSQQSENCNTSKQHTTMLKTLSNFFTSNELVKFILEYNSKTSSSTLKLYIVASSLVAIYGIIGLLAMLGVFCHSSVWYFLYFTAFVLIGAFGIFVNSYILFKREDATKDSILDFAFECLKSESAVGSSNSDFAIETPNGMRLSDHKLERSKTDFEKISEFISIPEIIRHIIKVTNGNVTTIKSGPSSAKLGLNYQVEKGTFKKVIIKVTNDEVLEIEVKGLDANGVQISADYAVDLPYVGGVQFTVSNSTKGVWNLDSVKSEVVYDKTAEELKEIIFNHLS